MREPQTLEEYDASYRKRCEQLAKAEERAEDYKTKYEQTYSKYHELQALLFAIVFFSVFIGGCCTILMHKHPFAAMLLGGIYLAYFLFKGIAH